MPSSKQKERREKQKGVRVTHGWRGRVCPLCGWGYAMGRDGYKCSNPRCKEEA